MKVLWVVNQMLPVIAESLNVPYSNKEGWLDGISRQVCKTAAFDLNVCFPGDVPDGKAGEINYYSFAEDTVHEETYDTSLEDRLKEIIASCEPDIVHIFGTEYGHSLAAMKAFGNPDRTLVGLQGICSEIAKHYLDGIPEKVAKRNTLRDMLKKDNLISQKDKMCLRGERETEVLRLAKHVTGRTSFDKNAALSVNPKLQYHFLNETLRKAFYTGKWKLKDAERHSIFVSQGNYPIKGLHYVLMAMPLILEQYSDAKLYVAGDNITKSSLLEKAKISSYGLYLLELIKMGNLKDHVIFTGPLSESEMKDRMLKSHVLLSASVIENSPNSVCEAMLLGVPVVASEVGGVPDLISDGVDGLLYTASKSSALSTAIIRIFDDPERTELMSIVGTTTAKDRHDPARNYARLLYIYKGLLNENNICK